MTDTIDTTDIPELTEAHFARAIRGDVRLRLMAGKFESGKDIAALRRFVGLTQAQFAGAMGISVHTLRNWEQGRRQPEGPAIALLRIAARHPRIIRQSARSAAPTTVDRVVTRRAPRVASRLAFARTRAGRKKAAQPIRQRHARSIRR